MCTQSVANPFLVCQADTAQELHKSHRSGHPEARDQIACSLAGLQGQPCCLNESLLLQSIDVAQSHHRHDHQGQKLLAILMQPWLAVWLHTVWQGAGAVRRQIMTSALASAAHRIAAATAAPRPRSASPTDAEAVVSERQQQASLHHSQHFSKSLRNYFVPQAPHAAHAQLGSPWVHVIPDTCLNPCERQNPGRGQKLIWQHLGVCEPGVCEHGRHARASDQVAAAETAVGDGPGVAGEP